MQLAPIVPVRDRCLPVDEALIPLFPDGGLQRGRVVGCSGPAAMTLAVVLATRSIVSGSWLAVVGAPMLGVEAAVELGLPLSRVVQVEVVGGPAAWAERVAAAVDGFDLVLTHPPAGADRVLRKVRSRLQARGAVLLAVSAGPASVSCDVELTTTSVTWTGLGQGHGHLAGRRAMVRSGGRRIPRPIEREIWLPGPHGRVEPVADSPDRHSGIEPVEPVAVAQLSRAG
jgi:hypothetical protein